MIGKDNLVREQLIKDYEVINYHVLEGMADWVRVVDKGGTIIYANKAMERELGENIIGSKCYEIHKNINGPDFCITQRSISTGEIVQKEETIKGQYYSIKSSPVRNAKGEIFAAVEVFRNITRERKLELELIGKNQKMNKDLQFAKRIQEKILPQKGLKEGVKLDYIYKPSEMLSGDMFDMFNIDKDNIGIYISDVAGHGVSASMMTMFIRQTMRLMKEEFTSPGDAMRELHRRFLKLGLESSNYFTIFYGIYNRREGSFKYVNAGHNCIPIKYNDETMNLLENKGYPITSLFSKILYEEKEIQLDSGDKILFYTDGITEAKNSSGEEFGLDGVLDIVKKYPDDILNQIESNIINYSWGLQDDDFAIVLLELINGA